MRRLLVAFAALVAVASPLTASRVVPAATPTPPPLAVGAWSPAPIRWGPCTDATLTGWGAQCGTLIVPLDYGHPSGAKIQLAVSRMRHAGPVSRYQGVMLVNPGGPGGSGLIYSVLQAFVPNAVGNAYDWIGFDPRGVGASRPALHCDPTYAQGPRPVYEPTVSGAEHAWLERTRGYGEVCARAAGALLGHLRTTDTVEDMESLRRALGASRISYYGYSYGTYLGQVYATRHPDRVHRMVLDANIDPSQVWYAANLNQDKPFEAVLTRFWAWEARYDRFFHLGRTEEAVERLWYATRNRLRRAPAAGVVGWAEWTDIFQIAGYTPAAWEDLSRLFSLWVHAPSPVDLAKIYDGIASVGDDNHYAAYLAVQCTDTPWPSRWTAWRRDNTQLATVAPFLTWANAWFNAPCRTWPVKPGTPVPVDGRAAPPMLLVDATLDAPTPFAGSLAVRHLFPRSALVSLSGGLTHGSSLLGDTCLDTTVAAYLATGVLPARRPGNRADATCPPRPLPVPGTASGSLPVTRSWGAARLWARLAMALPPRSLAGGLPTPGLFH